MDKTALPLRAGGDGLVLWPLIASLGALLAFGLLGSYSGLIIIPIGLLALIVGIWCFALAVGNAWLRKWRRAASFAVLPVAIVITVLAPFLVLPPFMMLGDYLHLLADQSAFEAEIAKQGQPIGERFRIFDWGGWGGTNRAVIYNDSDEIALPPGSRDWGDLGGGPAKRCAGHVTKITGHFYVCGW